MTAALQNAKGPAALAGAPDHGSINPAKEIEMNVHSNITTDAPLPTSQMHPAAGAMPSHALLAAIDRYQHAYDAWANSVPPDDDLPCDGELYAAFTIEEARLPAASGRLLVL